MYNTYIETILENRVIATLPEEKRNINENNSEALQNRRSYAFLIFVVSRILSIERRLNTDEREVLEYITDGGNDNGIDAIYIDEEDGEGSISFFQSKCYKKNNFNNQIGEEEIKKVLGTIENILTDKDFLSNNHTNPKLQDKIKAIKRMQKTCFPKIKVYFISNTEENKTINGSCQKILNTKQYIEFFDINAKQIYSYINIDNDKEKYKKISITSIKQGERYDIAGIPTYTLNIKASELIKLYEERGGEKILSDNVRYDLGNTKINQKIQKTINDKTYSKFFYLFNNGISIIADTIDSPDIISNDGEGNRKLTLTNPRIINGGQTTKSLYKIYEKNSKNLDILKDIQILVRLYQTIDPDLIEKITIGTNSQNAVQFRDLKSNNNIQNQVKTYFYTKKVGLEVKRGEFDINTNSKTNYSDIISNDLLIQIYISLYKKQPNIVKRKSTIFSENYFDTIFNEKNTEKENINLSLQFFRCYELWKIVNKKQDEILSNSKEDNYFLVNGIYAVLYCISLLEPNFLTNIENSLNTDLVLSKYEESIKIIKEIVDKQKGRQGNLYNHSDFFRSPESTFMIEEKINN